MFQFIEKIRDRYILLFLILLSVITYHSWISFDIFTFADYGYKFPETLKDYVNLSTWVNRSVLGFPDALLWRTPLLLLQSTFGHLGFGLNVAEKFTIMWVWIILPVISSYLLVKYIAKSKIAGIIGSLIFCYNTYFLSINSAGHFNISIAAAFGILSLLFLIKVNEEKKFRNILLSAITLFATSIYDLRVLYMMILIYILYFLFQFLDRKNWKLSVFLKILKKYSFISILLSLLSIYWVVPTILGGSLATSSTLSRGLFGDDFWNLKSAIALHHPFWNWSEPNWFFPSPTPSYLLVLPIMAIFGLVLSRRNRNTIFFALITVIGIFLTKQLDEPFGNIYLWLFDNFPGFNAFREATKFYIYIAIGYSILIGVFYGKILNIKSKPVWDILKLTLVAIISIIFLLNSYLIMTGKVGSTYVKRELSSDAITASKFISSQDNYFRTLLVPTQPHAWTYTNHHPRISLANVVGGTWFEVSNRISREGDEDLGISILNQEFSNELLDQASIKYVVVGYTEKEEKDNFFNFYGKNREYYSSAVSKLPYLKKVEVGFKEAEIYENENYRPLIYLTDSQESVNKALPFKEIDYSNISPSHYKISLKDVDSIKYLNLSQEFNPMWKIIIGDINLLSFNNILPTNFHIRKDSGLNEFIIDSEYIKNNISDEKYTINKDGSISFNATLVYYPELFLFPGLIVSVLTLITVIAFIIKRRKDN